MVELLIAIILILVMVAAVTAIAFAAQRLDERASTTWKKVGADLGLSFGTHQVDVGGDAFEAHRSLQGEIDGVPVTFASGHDTVSSSRHRLTRGYVRLDPPLPLDFAIRSNDLNEKIATRLVAEDVKTGDKSFDDRLAVRCEDRAGVVSLLTPQARKALLDLSKQGKVVVDKRGVTISVLPSYIDNEARLRTLVENLAEAGKAIRAARTDLGGVRFDFDEPELSEPSTNLRLPELAEVAAAASKKK